MNLYYLNIVIHLLVNLQRFMRENRRRNAMAELKDPDASIQQIYNPLNIRNNNQNPKNSHVLDSMKNLFTEKQIQGEVLQQFKSNSRPNKSYKESTKSQIRSKVILNTMNPKQSRSQKTQSQMSGISSEDIYNFNNLIKMVHPETPGFKNLLQSPFTKFNTIHQQIINDLIKGKESKAAAEPLSFNASPFTCYDQDRNIFNSGKYFVGMCMSAKEKFMYFEALFFAKLACYSDPYSQMAWKKYISLEEERGNFERAGRLAKTGFLFTHGQDLARAYLTDTDKARSNSSVQIQGLLATLQNPQVFERLIVPESAKSQLKDKNSWKGVKILYELIYHNDFKLAVCSLIIFLAKYMENIGHIEEALNLLKRSFARTMSKLQIYTLFIQMTIRKYGFLRENDISDVMAYVENISGENRFKLYLELAEYFFNINDQRFNHFIKQAYEDAKKNCAPGAGCHKALRHIYFFVTKLKGIPPLVQQGLNDQLIFQKNRYLFINGEPLIDFEFSDWKYYLHYGLIKRDDALLKSTKRWPFTGRLVAEWIHCLRTKRPALQILKVWRQKIEQVPKSGELWCEGGRIYAELGEYKNASRCFKEAMHFTPQFGDSFIEELKLLMKGGQMTRIQNLKKAFFVSEPFYGQILSYIKINHPTKRKLSMNQIWSNAVSELQKLIYHPDRHMDPEDHLFCKLTAYRPYNQAYINSSSKEERAKLFASYQQLENKC